MTNDLRVPTSKPKLEKAQTVEAGGGISSMLNKLTFGFFGPTQSENEPKVIAEEEPAGNVDEELPIECQYCRKMISSRLIDSHELECQRTDEATDLNKQPTTYDR